MLLANFYLTYKKKTCTVYDIKKNKNFPLLYFSSSLLSSLYYIITILLYLEYIYSMLLEMGTNMINTFRLRKISSESPILNPAGTSPVSPAVRIVYCAVKYFRNKTTLAKISGNKKAFQRALQLLFFLFQIGEKIAMNKNLKIVPPRRTKNKNKSFWKK